MLSSKSNFYRAFTGSLTIFPRRPFLTDPRTPHSSPQPCATAQLLPKASLSAWPTGTSLAAVLHSRAESSPVGGGFNLFSLYREQLGTVHYNLNVLFFWSCSHTGIHPKENFSQSAKMYMHMDSLWVIIDNSEPRITKMIINGRWIK